MLSIIPAPEKKGSKKGPPFFQDLCRRNFFLLKRDFLLPFRMPRGEGIEMAEGVEDGTKLPPPLPGRQRKSGGGAFKKSRGDFSLFLLSSVGGAFLYMCARCRGSPKKAERRGKGGGKEKKSLSPPPSTESQGMGWRKGIRRGEKKSFSGRFFYRKFMRDSLRSSPCPALAAPGAVSSSSPLASTPPARRSRRNRSRSQASSLAGSAKSDFPQ